MSSLAEKLAANASPKCCVCSKSVYKTEEVKAVGKIYHKSCFCCSIPENNGCGKVMTIMGGYLVRDGRVPYCKTCYNKLYGTKGVNSAVVDTEEVTQTAKATAYTPPMDKSNEVTEKMSSASISPTPSSASAPAPQRRESSASISPTPSSASAPAPQRRESSANKAMAELEAAKNMYKTSSQGFGGKKEQKETESPAPASAPATVFSSTPTVQKAEVPPVVASTSTSTPTSTTGSNFRHPGTQIGTQKGPGPAIKRGSVGSIAKRFSGAGDDLQAAAATARATATSTSTTSTSNSSGNVRRLSAGASAAPSYVKSTVPSYKKEELTPTPAVKLTPVVRAPVPAPATFQATTKATAGATSSSTSKTGIVVGGRLEHDVHKEKSFQGDGDEVDEAEWD